jgi:Domain of unknown function (DUF1707)
MAGDPRIRASDDDRERTVALLREHHAAGRLTVEEFNERMDKAYAAKTLGDLDELMTDLPAIDLYRLPDASLPPHYRRQIPGAGSFQAATGAAGLTMGHGRFSPVWAAAWGSWLSVTLLCFVIWALSGGGYLWPLWLAGPWGAIMVGRWISGSHPGGGPNRPSHPNHPHRPRRDHPGQIGGDPSDR